MEIRISEELNRIINYAREEAMRTGNYGISPDHLFLGIIRHRNNAAAEALAGLGVDLDDMKRSIDERLFTNEPIPFSETDAVTFSRGAHNVLSMTVLEATRLMTTVASPEHLLLALCHYAGGGFGKTMLSDMGVDYKAVLNYMEKAGLLQPYGGENPEPSHNASGDMESTSERKESSVLDDFGYDITKAAMDGKLDPVTGRETEIERVIQILGRRKKNNPMLVGDPGVGKSAIVEGIALKIASGEVPPSLLGKRLVSLDIASVVAGTKYRGDFEKRLKSIIREISGNDDIILFIDEFHTIVGAGGASGSLDAANMLKPALARGEIHCIGATTMDEFAKIVEKDGALDRRFQKIIVEPTDVEQTVTILHSIKDGYEAHHGVTYRDDALRACATLSDRYISDRNLPDKAIDAMDEAGSMVKLMCASENHGRKSAEVTPEDIAAVISKMTGIPVSKVAESEISRLMKMKDWLGKRIAGQDEAIDCIVNAIKRNRAGIKDPDRPIGSFLFFGPTGVGKTQLAKSLAEYLFGSEENMVRMDMSEYMEKFTASRLVGAPPGYVGYDEGGQLSEAVRRKPYCVVLLDEIEKAHPDIFNLLLQVLDEGRLTDGNGRTVNFRNTIVIMTSNVGSREISEFGNGLGFITSASKNTDNRKAIVEKAVRRTFPPEFLNRVDEQVFFNTLDRDSMEKIIGIELKDLKKRIGAAGADLSITARVKNFITDVGFDPDYGARPLKRAIRKYIEDPVAEFIIEMKARKQTSGKLHISVGLSKDGTNTTVTCK